MSYQIPFSEVGEVIEKRWVPFCVVWMEGCDYRYKDRHPYL